MLIDLNQRTASHQQPMQILQTRFGEFVAPQLADSVVGQVQDLYFRAQLGRYTVERSVATFGRFFARFPLAHTLVLLTIVLPINVTAC
jgi:hypothetical protein